MTDPEATSAKYAGRGKPYPPTKPLPAEELEAKKEDEPRQQPSKNPFCCRCAYSAGLGRHDRPFCSWLSGP